MGSSIIRPLQRTSKTILHLHKQPKIRPIMNHMIHNLKPSSYSTTTQTLPSEIAKDPADLNLLKLLRYEIQYEIDTSTPSQPVPEFNSFSVDEKPSEQWIRLTRNFGENEEIKVEATMLDAYMKNHHVYQDLKLYVSMLVGIRKGEGNDVLEFVCSVWPDRIKISDVYTRNEKRAGQLYKGPGFQDLDDELQRALYEYLEERGIDVKLATFLHKYMKNKEKSEFVRWMERIKSFMEMK